MTTWAEPQPAVSRWLLQAAEDRALAREQWREGNGGVALLACGGILSAIRAPAALVHAALEAETPRDVDAALRRWFDGGAVFMDLHSRAYYFLVPGSTAWRRTERELPGVECCGQDHYLGVPAIRLTEARGRSYWCLPPSGPGELCVLDEVEQLLMRGQAARRDSARAQ
ncbi:hypothetical protein [Streptomyces fuscigenes]|uniref:hypothetical protein n=1 Tax=Streptomyces fuscigenes TaxID=1528880 RepID=UPI001F430F68|nr:hypothetical protein [Streptomyces fuscigenes]MCF3960591.1 hypothetical protein [Streptomyces fuscigenes]